MDYWSCAPNSRMHNLCVLFVIAIASRAATGAAVPHSFATIIPAESPLTASPWYISPADVEPRFVRSASASNDDYTSGISSLLDAYFADAVSRHPDFSADERQAPKSQALRQPRQHSNDDHNSNDDDEDDAFAAVPVTEEDNDGDGDDTSNAPVYDQKFHDHEYDRIREASKKQEKEIVARNPKHCKVTYKDGMECSVCKDPKSGAHSQSCTFSSTAPAKKYAYTKERNYNSRDKDKDKDGGGEADDDGEDEDDDEAGDDESGEGSKTNNHRTKDINPPKRTKSKPNGHQVRYYQHGRQHSNQPKKTSKSAGKKQRPVYLLSYASDDDDWRPILAPYRHHSYAAQASEQHADVVAAEPFLFGVRASEALSTSKQKKRNVDDDEDDDEGKFSFERFFARDFPEAKSAGLIRKQADGDGSGDGGEDGDDGDDDDTSPDAVEFLPEYDGKRNVEKVLAEFKKRDWSKCERKLRDSLTCYVCHDDRGVRHEECMFVSGGGGDGDDDGGDKTQNSGNSHLSYTETKEYHDDGHNDKNKNGKKSSEGLPKAYGPKSEQLRQSDGGNEDDHDDYESNEDVEPVKQRKHISKKTVIVRRRQHHSPAVGKVADAGVHQASNKRTIKRQTAEGTADYAHLIRHDPPPKLSSSLKTY